MGKPTIKDLIETLMHIREKPVLWVGVGANRSAALTHFIQGLELGCSFANIQMGDRSPMDELWKEVTSSHGLEYTAQHICGQMQDMGYDFDRIVQELIDIEIEVLKRRHKME